MNVNIIREEDRFNTGYYRGQKQAFKESSELAKEYGHDRLAKLLEAKGEE